MKNRFYPIFRSSEKLFSEGEKRIEKVILTNSHKGIKTLLLLSGGSAIKSYIKLADFLESRNNLSSLLAIAQIDERFCPINTHDINALEIGKSALWDICGKEKIPYFLVNQEGKLLNSARIYDKLLTSLFKNYGYKMGVFGVGEDGHTAGLLPLFRKSWDKEKLVVGYHNTGMYSRRISITPKAIVDLDMSLVMADGEEKKEAVKKLLFPSGDKNINKIPAMILRKCRKTVFLYSQKI